MKTKRLMATLLTLSLVASIALVGCGKKTEVPKTDTTKPATEAKMDATQFINGILVTGAKIT